MRQRKPFTVRRVTRRHRHNLAGASAAPWGVDALAGPVHSSQLRLDREPEIQRDRLRPGLGAGRPAYCNRPDPRGRVRLRHRRGRWLPTGSCSVHLSHCRGVLTRHAQQPRQFTSPFHDQVECCRRISIRRQRNVGENIAEGVRTQQPLLQGSPVPSTLHRNIGRPRLVLVDGGVGMVRVQQPGAAYQAGKADSTVGRPSAVFSRRLAAAQRGFQICRGKARITACLAYLALRHPRPGIGHPNRSPRPCDSTDQHIESRERPRMNGTS